MDEKLGRNKRRSGSIGVEVIHWLVYWPIYAVYFIFEAAKTIFTRIQKFTKPIFVLTIVLSNRLFPKIFEIENLLIFRKIIFKSQWLSYLYDFVGEFDESWYGVILWSLAAITILLAIYILPALAVYLFVAAFSDDFNKRFDWVGYERTFQNILQILRKKTQERYQTRKESFVKSMAPGILINIVCTVGIVVIVRFAPIGMRKLSEVTGYGQKAVKEEMMTYKEADKTEDEAESGGAENGRMEFGEEPMEDFMIITADSANIRSGPGMDYDIVCVADKDDLLISTGNQETASNGRIWYEVYVDDGFGWLSEKVAEIVQE